MERKPVTVPMAEAVDPLGIRIRDWRRTDCPMAEPDRIDPKILPANVVTLCAFAEFSESPMITYSFPSGPNWIIPPL